MLDMIVREELGATDEEEWCGIAVAQPQLDRDMLDMRSTSLTTCGIDKLVFFWLRG